MNNQEQKRVETHCWEFTLPITITVLAHYELKYPDAFQKLKDIPKEDVYKAFLNAINNHDFKSGYPAWYGGEHLKEGIYLRELAYDEKYRGKTVEEEPILLDCAKCQVCGKITPFTDEGGRCETEIGWMCHECIEDAQKYGAELHFQDEEL